MAAQRQQQSSDLLLSQQLPAPQTQQVQMTGAMTSWRVSLFGCLLQVTGMQLLVRTEMASIHSKGFWMCPAESGPLVGPEAAFVALVAYDTSAQLQRLIVAAAHGTLPAAGAPQGHVKVVLAAPVAAAGQLAQRLSRPGVALC